MGVYLTQPKEGIKVTLELLQWFRGFIRSDCTLARSPWEKTDTLTKEEAQRQLTEMVNTAINRKAGWEPRGRKDCPEYRRKCYRDQQRLRKHVEIRLMIRERVFETEEVRRRFRHYVTRDEEI